MTKKTNVAITPTHSIKVCICIPLFFVTMASAPVSQVLGFQVWTTKGNFICFHFIILSLSWIEFLANILCLGIFLKVLILWFSLWSCKDCCGDKQFIWIFIDNFIWNYCYSYSEIIIFPFICLFLKL